MLNTTLVFDPRGNGHGALRQDPSVQLRKGRGIVRRGAHHLPRQRSPHLRVAVRPRQFVGLLRSALPRAVPAHGRLRADGGAVGVYLRRGRAHCRRCCCARAPSKTSATCWPRRKAGKHENGRRTWGHSMLIDPWGEIVAVRDEGAGRGRGDARTRRASTRCGRALPRMASPGC